MTSGPLVFKYGRHIRGYRGTRSQREVLLMLVWGICLWVLPSASTTIPITPGGTSITSMFLLVSFLADVR